MSRPHIYPRRGLHGEVVHTIGLQIVSGQLQPGDPLPPEDELTSDLAVSRTVLREAVRVLAAKGLVLARPKIGTRVRERSDWNILDPDVLSWRAEAAHDQKLYEETTEIRLAIEPLAARLAATRATDEEVAAITEAFAAMEAGVDDQPVVPRGRPGVPRADPRLVPQRAPRAPRPGPAGRPARDVPARPRRRAGRGDGRSRFTGRSSTGSSPATRMRPRSRRGR